MSAAESPLPTEFDLKGRKILLVDDDRLNIRILSGILNAEGVTMAAAGSGEAALELYPRFRPDLILLDVVMPGINGFETCRRLKQTHGDACAPVIFITAKNESDDIVDGLAAGGVDYLPKPFHPKEAVARIRIHVQNRQYLEQQKKLVDQLSRANAAKNRFLGMAAHDLRNPLASIRGLAEFLQDGTVGVLTAEQVDLVNNIHEASQSMLTLVNDLLDYSVIEAGRLQIHPAETSLNDLVTKATRRAQVNATKKGTILTFTDGADPGKVFLDAEKISQVIDNLLSNAVKFSPPKSTVTIKLSTSPGSVAVWVRDQGPGIPDGERHKLFNDFGQTSVRPTAGERSTGLGLAICKNIIEAHRGSISVDNEPSGGCTFKVTLPSPK